jgi:integrase
VFIPGSEPTPADQRVLAWVRQHSRSITELESPAVARRVLDRLARRIDGSPAAASTLARKRAVFHNALDAAVDAGYLKTNPMAQVRGPRRAAPLALDPRSVVNPEQAAALIEAVRTDTPALEAFFACIYYAGTRPAEALGLTRQQLHLPDSGWGELELTGSEQATARIWTDGESTRQDRPLKHRPPGAVRYAPAPPELVRILRRHLDTFACGVRGHLFVARTGKAGRPLSPPYEVTVGMNTVYRAWDKARRAVLTDAEYRSPLARRPYDLRHAYVSTWLGAGVSPADIAGQAGQSTRVMLQVYSHPVAGRQRWNQEAVERMLAVHESDDRDH